jgi:hypothetical protein
MTSPTPEPKVSAVIVSYNTRDLLRRAIRSVIEECEVVVVDNASTDGSAEMVASEFPGVVLIRNQHNAGFGAANNQGIEASSASLILLLNSDAEAKTGAVAELARVLDDLSVVAAGGKLLHPDGRLQESAAGPLTLWAVFCEQSLLEKAFKRSRVFSPYWLSERLLGTGVSFARPGGQPQEDAHPHLHPPPQPGSKRKTAAERLQGRHSRAVPRGPGHGGVLDDAAGGAVRRAVLLVLRGHGVVRAALPARADSVRADGGVLARVGLKQPDALAGGGSLQPR